MGTGPHREKYAVRYLSWYLPLIPGSATEAKRVRCGGADAVRVGTRFLACPECHRHQDYLRALIAAGADDTVLTNHFDNDGQWPGRVRVLRSSLDAAISVGNRGTSPPTATAEGPLAMACHAGLSVERVREITPAAEIVRQLTSLLG
jgi:nitronate monooxygenase